MTTALNPQIAPESPAFSAAYLSLFVRLLAAKGIDTDAWLQQAGIDEAQLADAQAHISFAQTEKLLQNPEILALFDTLGLEAGEHLTIFSHGVVGHLAMTGNTAVDALRFFLRYLKLRTQMVSFELSLEGVDLQIRFSTQVQHPALQHLISDSALSGSWHLINALLDNRPAISHIGFNREPTTAHQIFADRVYCPVSFGHEQAFIRINLLAAVRPSRTANPAIQKVALQQCTALLQEFDAGDTVSQRVRKQLLASPEYALSQERVAGSLNMTSRTLRRRLANEGTSFRELADTVMRAYVHTLLQEQRLSVADIADLLGYSNDSNFNKACKRWFGMSVKQYQQSLIQD